MIPYASRIPVEQSYVQAIGQVVYNFATVEWNMVYLGSLISPSFVNRESGADFETVAREFSLLSETGTIPDTAALSERFTKATARRQALLRSIPITANGGFQELNDSKVTENQWTEEAIWAFAKELEDLDIAANALYYKLKPPSK